MFRVVTCVAALALGLGGVRCGAEEIEPPFAIKARQQHVSVASVAATESWHRRFLSVADFVKKVRPDGFTTLASGKHDDIYYGLFRASPNLMVIAYASTTGNKSNSSVTLYGGGANRAEIAHVPWKKVELLSTVVETTAVKPPQLTQNKTYSLPGYVGQLPSGYAGPITVKFELWNEGKDKVRLKAVATVNWVSTP